MTSQIDPNDWLAQVRFAFRSGNLSTSPTIRQDLEAILRATVRRERDRISLSETASDTILDGFEYRLRTMGRMSQRSSSSISFLILSNKQQAAVADQFFNEFLELASQWGNTHSKSVVERIPAHYFTVADLQAFTLYLPRLKPFEVRRFMVTNPSDPLAAAERAIIARDEVMAFDESFSESEAMQLAMNFPTNTVAIARKALEWIDELVELDLGLSLGQIKRFAIGHPTDPVGTAKKALESVDQILALDRRINSGAARRIAIMMTRDPLATAKSVLAEAEAIEASGVEWHKAIEQAVTTTRPDKRQPIVDRQRKPMTILQSPVAPETKMDYLIETLGLEFTAKVLGESEATIRNWYDRKETPPAEFQQAALQVSRIVRPVLRAFGDSTIPWLMAPNENLAGESPVSALRGSLFSDVAAASRIALRNLGQNL